MRTILALAFAGCAGMAAAKPLIILNEDCNHFISQHIRSAKGKSGAPMQPADIVGYVDQWLHPAVTHYFVNPNGQAACYDSKVLETCWQTHHKIGCTCTSEWLLMLEDLAKRGIDPYAVMMGRAREKGVSPWISMRMNDVHYITETNRCSSTTFWREHPEFRRKPELEVKAGHGWSHYCFDYSHKEVRDLYLACAGEMLARYDADGIELDWMRWPTHLTPGKEIEQAPCLTEFMRGVRAHADAAAQRLGRPVKVAARVQTHPDEALRYGTDVFAWAREGLVDLVIPCNFLDCADYALPLTEWKERLAAVNPGVKVIPGTDHGVTKEYQNWRNCQLFTVPELRGFFERLLAQGAEGFYFFNHFDMGRATEAGRYVSVAGELDAAKIAALPRAYPVTYRDSTLNNKHAGNQLPLSLAARKGRVEIASGKAPPSGTCDVLLGFGKAPPTDELFATVSLNGVLPLRREPVPVASWLGRTPESVASFKVHFPLSALKDDVNVLEIGGVPGQADLRAVELEVFPAPAYSDAEWAAKRAAAVNRPRPLVYNTDGCDVLYMPTNLAATAENFFGQRLVYALGTHASTISYCPISSGFGHFTARKAGEPFLNRVEGNGHDDCRNAAPEFFANGTDPLELAVDFCRSNGFEAFVSIRVNDTHDAHPEYGKSLSPEWKRKHPEMLMGTGHQGEGRPPFCNWTAVDFEQGEVRAHMKQFVRDFVTNYDVDGIEYDFNRHAQLFKTVAWGAEATDAQRALMTDFMSELRKITEDAGYRRGRPVVVAMRSPDSAGYCRAIGIDLEKWFASGLVDLWIGSGYFRLNPWPVSAALAHKHGVKFYASIDESRIPARCKQIKRPIIPGRGSRESFAGRYAAAMAGGCDGVYLFNQEYANLRRFAMIDPRRMSGIDKIYFAVERGSGGYQHKRYLKDGDRFSNMPRLDPGESQLITVAPGETYSFAMTLGDDFAAVAGDAAPSARLLALTNLPDDANPALSCNGETLQAVGAKDGLFEFRPDPALLKCGENRFALTVPADVKQTATFNDFAVEVKYVPAKPTRPSP